MEKLILTVCKECRNIKRCFKVDDKEHESWSPITPKEKEDLYFIRGGLEVKSELCPTCKEVKGGSDRVK